MRGAGGQRGALLEVCSDPQALAGLLPASRALNLPTNQGAGTARGQADTCLEVQAEAPRGPRSSKGADQAPQGEGQAGEAAVSRPPCPGHWSL